MLEIFFVFGDIIRQVGAKPQKGDAMSGIEGVVIYPTIDAFVGEMFREGIYANDEAELCYAAEALVVRLADDASTDLERLVVKRLKHFTAVVGVGDSHRAIGELVDAMRQLKLTRGLNDQGEGVLALAEEVYNAAQAA